MPEVPEHLLRRSRERRQALGLPVEGEQSAPAAESAGEGPAEGAAAPSAPASCSVAISETSARMLSRTSSTGNPRALAFASADCLRSSSGTSGMVTAVPIRRRPSGLSRSERP